MLRTGKWGPLILGALCASLSLAGCSSPEPEKTPAAQSPGDASSLSSASNYVYECLTEKGWDVTLTWDGGIEASSDTIPEAQVDLYRADSDECWAKVDDRIAAMQPEEISRIYASELETRDCLIEQGFDVGTPPSEQEYIDSFQGIRWSAYGDSDAVSSIGGDEEWRKINEACPQPSWSLGAP